MGTLLHAIKLLVGLLLFFLCSPVYAQRIPPAFLDNRALDGRAIYCADAGTTDAYACNLSPAPTSYVTGAGYRFKANTANTGAATINFNSLGAKTIKKAAGGITTDLADNDIRAGQIVEVSYDGTNFQMQGTLGNAGGGGGGSPGGTNLQVQFNDGGAFGGDAGLTYDKTTDIVTSSGGVIAGNCSTNCLSHDTGAITGSKTVTWPNESGTVRFRTNNVYWDASALSPDGTNCAVPTEQTLNTGPLTWAFSCADSNSSIFYGKVRLLYALTTATFTIGVFHATSEAITFAGDFSAMCRADGTVIDGTWGAVQAADVSITTANRTEFQTSAAVTPNGTCSAGSWLFVRYVVDATNFSTNAANAKVLGVAMDQAS